ncbi:hypothetical protein ACLOJK_021365 [Asimina triloba]
MASDKFQKSYFDVLVIVVHDNLLISQIQIETLQRYATMRSKEAMSLIGNKHKQVGSLDTSNDEAVGISFAGLSMLVLEAVAFGSFLSFGINALSGSIPKEFGNLRNIRSLSFASNQFTGPIPPDLGNLVTLRQM